MPVSVQAMAFGNLGNASAVGIAATRCCETGEKKLTGNFAVRAQGNEADTTNIRQDISRLADNFPKVYEAIQKISGILERHYKDVQTIEFTIENNKLYMLQTSAADRTAEAALKIAVDMVSEELITQKTAILRQDAEKMEQVISKIESGAIPCESELKRNYDTLMEWVDDVRELKVRVNADSAGQAAEAAKLGAEGIGLCRTENMLYNDGKDANAERDAFDAGYRKSRERCFKTSKKSRKRNFEQLYRIMGERPVTIRLLDLPVTLPEITGDADRGSHRSGT